MGPKVNGSEKGKTFNKGLQCFSIKRIRAANGRTHGFIEFYLKMGDAILYFYSDRKDPLEKKIIS